MLSYLQFPNRRLLNRLCRVFLPVSFYTFLVFTNGHAVSGQLSSDGVGNSKQPRLQTTQTTSPSKGQICDQTDRLTFTSNDIFDLNDNDTIFLHRWANFLHVKTKESTLLNETAFFINKCEITKDDLEELERHLRNKKFIRDATVKFSVQDSTNSGKSEKSAAIEVETWDNWSLLPTFDLGRKGGQNKFAIGIQERNFLGLGIDAEIEYFTNAQRTGYKFDTHFPLFLKKNINGAIRLTDSDDGSTQAFFVQKEFASFDTEYAFTVGIDNAELIDTFFENGIQASRYHHKKQFSMVSWRWLQKNTESDTWRLGVGLKNEKHEFLNNENETILTLPADRHFTYPFLSVQYVQKDFKKLQNLNLINKIEDFNLGWQFYAELGHDVSSRERAPDYIWRSSMARGYHLSNDSFLFLHAAFNGESYDKSSGTVYAHNSRSLNRFEPDTRAWFQIKTEYFKKFNDQWAGYFKNTNVLSQNQFLDAPVELGGESGVRGYPIQFQHGQHSTQFTFEARYYPQINIYKLVELGGAAFIETGKVFGRSNSTIKGSNDEQYYNGNMTSIGVGARLYSSHSSEAKVIHIDIIKPISEYENVNSVEFRMTSRNSF